MLIDSVAPAAPTLRRHGIPVLSRPDRLVQRTTIIERILADPGPIIIVEGPAGSGKTTLLAEWALADPRPSAWLTVVSAHSDPVVLLRALASALAAIHPIGPLAHAPRLVTGADPLRSLGRLTRAIGEEPEPTLLIIDDLHRLPDGQAIDLIANLADRYPSRGRIALATRTRRTLPYSRWQLAGRALIIGRESLDFDARECSEFLDRLGIADADRLAPVVQQRTDGWAAAVHLMGLSYRERPTRSTHLDSDATGLIDEYIESEILAPLDAATRTMLVRTSVLDVVTGPLADTVSGLTGCAERLSQLADDVPLVIATDAARDSFRYHTLLRAALARELARDPPTEVEARARAAAWYQEAGLFDDAIEQALGGGDLERAAQLVLDVAQTKYRAGEANTLERWIEAFDEAAIRERPDLAALAAFLWALEGEAPLAAHWATMMEPSAQAEALSEGNGPGAVLVSAMLCASGPEAMLDDATGVLADHGEDWRWRTTAVFAAGMAALMLDRPDTAAARFQELERTHGYDVAAIRFTGRAERALAELGQRRWSAAQSILDVDRAAVLADPESGRIGALTWLVADARLAIHRGDMQAANDRLQRVHVGRARLSWAIPWHAVHTLTELARAQLLVSDHQGARVSLSDARDIIAARPLLGSLIHDLELVSEQAMAAPRGERSWSSLTRAELRLLPYLQTYLTIKEIGERLGVSPNTAKTQALSIYGKLGASTRSEAIEAAVSRGLLEDVFADRPGELASAPARA